MLTRKELIRYVLAAAVLAPWGRALGGTASRFLQADSDPAATGSGGPPYSGEIVLGVSAAFSGPSRGLGTELYRGASAYFSRVNEAGGINGRRIVLKMYDDGYQPDPCVENTMKLMLEDQVFLLFGYVGTPTVTRVLPLLKKFQDENIFMFFPFTGAQPQRQPPYGDFAFNLRASYAQETAGLVNNFVSIGKERIAVFYQADAYGRSGWAGVRAALAPHGLRIAGEATYSRGANYTGTMRRQVEILKASSPDAVICIGAYAACAAFARDAVDFELDVPIANLSFVGSENMLKLLTEGREDSESYTRLLVNSQVVPSYEDLSLPAVREYRDLLDRYDPQVPPELVKEEYAPFPYSFGALEGFLNAKLLAEIIRRLEGEADRAKLEQAVFSVTDYDLGVGERVSFGPNRRQGLQTVYYTVVEDGRFVPLNDWQAKFA
ncbi:MAG: ABC transporter substrate-binding protein [Gammaproteobacteria bacterium]|nr:ABC transporter substrate-binding protein [Gammaproteobacteria bacterium]MXW45904.1 ABC transporter substrate-binding protein [Gammaproteobacteria bacterium]MYD00772.1 ABC transporter substrate-binding protein [Gammaproteobacteria bacterium]MYI25440.1 ABC transporter substrate-binding protein [Gammaproteobacteria bacterium]